MQYLEFDPSLTEAASQAVLRNAASLVVGAPMSEALVTKARLEIMDYANAIGTSDYERIHGLLVPGDEIELNAGPNFLKLRALDLMKPLARHAGDARWQAYERTLRGPWGRLAKRAMYDTFNPLFADQAVVSSLESAIKVAKTSTMAKDAVFTDGHTFAQTARLALFEHTISLMAAETDALTERLASSPRELRRAIGYTGLTVGNTANVATGTLQPAA